MIDLLHRAVLLLAGRCDGAVQQDAQGYNQSDTRFGHRLAGIPPEAWSAEMRRAAWHMLRKYGAQLARLGLDYRAIPEPANPARDLGADVVGVDESLMRHEARRAAYWAARESARPSPGHPWRTPSPPPAARRVEVLEDGRVRLRFPYDAALVQKVKSIPGARWNPEPADKSWTVPPTDVALPLLIDLITREGFTADNQEALLARLRECQAGVEARVAASAATDGDLTIPGFGLVPYPFQRAGALYALREKRVIIADEMGLGKTIEALMVLEAARAYPAVVVCPASVKLNWVREARRCLPKRNIVALESRPIRYPELYDILVLNYDVLVDRTTARPQADPERVADLRQREGLSLAAAKVQALADQGQQDEGPALRADLLRLHPKLRAVVLDEFHLVKNPKALRTKLAKKLTKDIEYRLALSGTPIVNRPEELLAPLQILDRLDDLGGYTKVRNRYAPLDLRTGRRGAAHLPELHRRIRALCYVRRRKSDVLAELPPIQYTTVPLEIDNRAEYESAARDVIAWLQVGVAKDRAFLASIAALQRAEQAERIRARQQEVAYRALQAEQLVRLNALKRLAARGKLAAAEEWIDLFLESEPKLVAFGHHVEIVQALAARYRAPSITGATPVVERQAAVDRFQTDPACLLIACNLQAGGVGITLTAASNVALLELPWTPAAVDQAVGRLHRIGQAESVMAWYLVGDRTIDLDIAALIDDKRGVVDAVTDGAAGEAETGILRALVSRLAGDAPVRAAAEAERQVADLWA